MNKVEEIEKNDVTNDNVTKPVKKQSKVDSKNTNKSTNSKTKKTSTVKNNKTEKQQTTAGTKRSSSQPNKNVTKKTTAKATKTKTTATVKAKEQATKAKVENKIDGKIEGNVEEKANSKTTKAKTVKAKLENETKSSIVLDTTNAKNENNSNITDKLENEVIKEEIKKFKVEKVDFEDKPKKSMLHKFTIFITIISILLFIGLIAFSTAFALVNRNSNKVVSGVSIKGIDISDLTYEEANSKISKMFNEKLSNSIKLKHNDYENYLNPEELEVSFKTKEALDISYSIGRSGKVLKDNYAIINAKLLKVNIDPSFSYNEQKLDELINEISENIPDAVQQSSYIIEGDNLKITKGQRGYVVKKEQLKNIILNNITNLEEQNVIEIPVEQKEPNNIDIDQIYLEIHKEPKDAYYTKEPFTVYPHVDGVTFNISMDEAKALLNNGQNEIIIPLKITKPNVTTNQIGTEAFPDLLASFSTTFSTSNRNRTTNIKLASNKINGVVLMPGEKFSYNKVVGQRTAAAGYKTAAVYVGGKVENGIGGGICQVSSTLYNTALRANLEIVNRSNHRFATGYVPLSTDATVSWGGPEFVFKNTRKYPIRIVSTVTGGKIKVDIYGLKEDVEYEVIIQSQTLQVIPMKTEYRTNTSLPVGTKKTVQKGHAGYKSRAYRILKLNGQIVSKQLLSTDTYAQLSTIIETN